MRKRTHILAAHGRFSVCGRMWSRPGNGDAFTKAHLATCGNCRRGLGLNIRESLELEAAMGTNEKQLKELHGILESVELFPGDKTNWTVQLVNEEEKDGPVVFRDEDGQDRMWMPMDVYEQFRELAAHRKK